jgi:copper-containing nitrite reductase
MRSGCSVLFRKDFILRKRVATLGCKRFSSNEKLKSVPIFLGVAVTAAATTLGTFYLVNQYPHYFLKETPTSPYSSVAAETVQEIAEEETTPMDELPVITNENEFMSFAPNVPPPITRKHPALLKVELQTIVKRSKLDELNDYEFWTFNGSVPGPFIRCRVGDVLEVHHKNLDPNGLGHNIDFHAATGPGGGASLTYAEKDQTKTARFRMLQAGLYVYHCAAAPVPAHIANGMYGTVLVEPRDGMPKVDKEFFVCQSEFYTEPSTIPGEKNLLDFDYQKGLDEKPTHVVFNGRQKALIDRPLLTNQGDRVRMYVANGGPNLTSSFHIIGSLFDRVYREGDMSSLPSRGIQSTLIPAGGASIVEFDALVPGNYTLVDHAIFRMDKGAIGFLKVLGNDPKKEIISSNDPPENCPDCKLH